MTSDDDQILQDYIERLLLWEDEHEDWLDEHALEAVARDLGLSDEDLARLDARTVAHRQRGQHFSANRAWDEAVGELRLAVVLDPFNVPLLHELAAAHFGRWQQTSEAEDRIAAERYARRSIELEPNHQPSYDLLATLMPLPASGGKPGIARVFKVGVAVASVLIAVAAVWTLRSAASSEAEAGLTASDSTSNGATEPALPTETELPVRLLGADEVRGLTLDVQRSLLKAYGSAFSYTLHATLLNDSAELHRLRMRLALIGAEGEELQTRYFDARASHESYLRPGDAAPISELIYEERPAPNLDHIRLSVDIVERAPAAAAYEAATPQTLDWRFDQPAHIELDVSERESRISATSTGQTHYLTLSAHNRGARSVQHLLLEVTWFDAQDAVITSERVYVVTSAGPAMRSGQTWVVRVIEQFPAGADAPFARYVVSVVEAE